LDDLVAVARCLFEQDQDGRSNVTSAKALAPAWREAAAEHLVTASEGTTAVSTRTSTATATTASRTPVALHALCVLVFMEFVIHLFSFVINLNITIYRYRTFVKGYT
jgi:hypothetical protein